MKKIFLMVLVCFAANFSAADVRCSTNISTFKEDMNRALQFYVEDYHSPIVQKFLVEPVGYVMVNNVVKQAGTGKIKLANGLCFSTTFMYEDQCLLVGGFGGSDNCD